MSTRACGCASRRSTSRFRSSSRFWKACPKARCRPRRCAGPPRQRRRRAGAGRRLPRRHPGLAAARLRRQGRALPSARPVVVPVAAAGGGHRGQHRRRLPALQQIVQLLLLGPRPLEADMRKLLFQSLLQSALTERAPSADDAHLAELAQSLGTAARRRLGRSLSIREVDAGSCNGCELEIHALNNAFYDIERFGLRFVASPRHADVLLVTGPVTKNMRRSAGAHLCRYARPQMGGGGGGLRRQLRGLRRQLCLCRRRFVRRSGRSAHRRLPAQPDGTAQGPDCPRRSDGSVMPSQFSTGFADPQRMKR